ncbi:MAG: class I SAM-dependent methyltransferase [Acidiferrobacterales bacterium]
MKSTDRAWERWGREHPYYGVLATDEFLSQNITENARKNFFRSGENHVEHILSVIQEHLAPEFEPRAVLDFGCGVGRLVLAFARRCQSVTGIDVSPSMLSEAKKNCQAANLGNVSFYQPNDGLSELSQQYNLIHSYLVFQHIPSSRGMRLCKTLTNKLSSDGILVLHLPYRCNAPWWIRALVRMRYMFPPLNMLRNLIKGVAFTQPAMQMNAYNLGSVVSLLRKNGIRNLYVELLPSGEFDSAIIYATKF